MSAVDLFSFKPSEREAFPIERGVPISNDRSPRQELAWSKPDFPFAKLGVGDSFVVRPDQCGGIELIRVQNLVSGAACQYRRTRKPGTWNYTTRQVGGRFVRCWRIE